jgi:HEAT repeat protein
LAELGDKGYDVVKAYLDTVLLPRVPEGPIGASAGFTFHKDKLEQCLMALLQFGPIARQYFLTLTKSPKPWIRRSITVAISGTRDASRFDTLLAYATTDPDEDVRAQTFDSLGKMAYAIDEAGPILVKALTTEKSEICLTHITKSLVELNYRAGVPALIGLLDHPDYPVVRAVMDALDALTGASRKLGQKLQTPADWKRYWEQKLKSTWK